MLINHCTYNYFFPAFVKLKFEEEWPAGVAM